MVIPAVEALHIGPIPRSAISALVLTDGRSLWKEVKSNAKAVQVLSRIDRALKADCKRRSEESPSGKEIRGSDILWAAANLNRIASEQELTRTSSKIVAALEYALTLDDWDAVKSTIADGEAAGLWRATALKVRRLHKPHPAICEGFHSMWIERGHRIRRQLGDDVLLLDVLSVLLPTYQGAGLTLYRGESAARWRARALGSAWTNDEECARMFARGLNAVLPGGGVLLSTDAPADAIITGPNARSIHLNKHEYVVDRRRLGKIKVMGRFPPVDGNY